MSRLGKAVAIRREYPLAQFGQPDSSLMGNGTKACAATVIQSLARIWHDRHVSINDVARLAGYVDSPSRGGLNPDEFQRACARLDLPYLVIFGVPWQELVLRTRTHGPVAFATRYGSWPQWKGYRYAGKVAHAPFARPLEKAGATQLIGFENGGHMNLLLGVATIANVTPVRYDAYVQEPNHGSAARPEKPPFDVVLSSQARDGYRDYERLLHRRPFAAIPTTAWEPT